MTQQQMTEAPQKVYTVQIEKDNRVIGVFSSLDEAKEYANQIRFSAFIGTTFIDGFTPGKPEYCDDELLSWRIEVSLTDGSFYELESGSTYEQGDNWITNQKGGERTGKVPSLRQLTNAMNDIYPSAVVESYLSQEHCIYWAKATYEKFLHLKKQLQTSAHT